jgi:PIN domain nuclease of toxin-antitoxin system
VDKFAFERLPVTDVHASAVRALLAVHRRPFDRLLVACQHVSARRLSADPIFDSYAATRTW